MEELIDTYVNQTGAESKFSEPLVQLLGIIVKWAYAVSISLYIFVGIFILSLVFTIWYSGLESFTFTTGCVQILSLSLNYALARTAQGFSTNVRRALETGDEQQLLRGFSNLNTFFKAIAIVGFLACCVTAMMLFTVFQQVLSL